MKRHITMHVSQDSTTGLVRWQVYRVVPAHQKPLQAGRSAKLGEGILDAHLEGGTLQENAVLLLNMAWMDYKAYVRRGGPQMDY